MAAKAPDPLPPFHQLCPLGSGGAVALGSDAAGLQMPLQGLLLRAQGLALLLQRLDTLHQLFHSFRRRGRGLGLLLFQCRKCSLGSGVVPLHAFQRLGGFGSGFAQRFLLLLQARTFLLGLVRLGPGQSLGMPLDLLGFGLSIGFGGGGRLLCFGGQLDQMIPLAEDLRAAVLQLLFFRKSSLVLAAGLVLQGLAVEQILFFFL